MLDGRLFLEFLFFQTGISKQGNSVKICQFSKLGDTHKSTQLYAGQSMGTLAAPLKLNPDGTLSASEHRIISDWLHCRLQSYRPTCTVGEWVPGQIAVGQLLQGGTSMHSEAQVQGVHDQGACFGLGLARSRKHHGSPIVRHRSPSSRRATPSSVAVWCYS